MTTDKQPTWDDLRRALQPVLTAGADIANRWMDLLDAARTELADLNGSAGAEPVDVATARDQVVTAALRYAAAEGDAGTSLADTNTALTVLDDALAGYVDATAGRENPPPVTAGEALQPGNEVEFTVRGVVTGEFVTVLGDDIGVDYAAEMGTDFRIIHRAEETS